MKTFVKDVRELVHRSSSSLWRTWLIFSVLSLTHPSIHPYIHISIHPLFLPPVSQPDLLHVKFTRCIIKAAEIESEPSQGLLSREDGLEVFFPLTVYCIHWPLLQCLGSYTFFLFWVTDKEYGCCGFNNLSSLIYIPYTFIPSFLITLYQSQMDKIPWVRLVSYFRFGSGMKNERDRVVLVALKHIPYHM